MALRHFGGAAANSAVVNPETGAWLPNDSGSVWTAETGGTQLTDLVDGNGASIGAAIYSDGYGYCQQFGVDTDPATEVVWVDFTGGLGKRVRMECWDRATYRLDQGTFDQQLGAKLDKAARGNPSGVAALDSVGRVLEGGDPLVEQYASLDPVTGLVESSQLPSTHDLSSYARKTEVPSLEETVACSVLVWPGESNPIDRTVAGGGVRTSPFFTAPFPMRILSCHFMTGGNVASNSTDVWRIELRRYRNGGGDTITYKTTEDEALSTRTGWELDGTWDESVRDLAVGDVLSVSAVVDAGSPSDLSGTSSVTIRYARL